MIEIEEKNKQIESIEKEGKVMNAEEQRMKEERLAIKGQKIIKSGCSGKFSKKTNFPKKERTYEEEDGIGYKSNEIDEIEEKYNKQNKEIERRER